MWCAFSCSNSPEGFHICVFLENVDLFAHKHDMFSVNPHCVFFHQLSVPSVIFGHNVFHCSGQRAASVPQYYTLKMVSPTEEINDFWCPNDYCGRRCVKSSPSGPTASKKVFPLSAQRSGSLELSGFQG